MDFSPININMIDMIILSVVSLAVFCTLLIGFYLKEKFNILLNKIKKGGQKK